MDRVACDVPAHNYTYSFEPKSDWSRVYAPADEIFLYFDTFKSKYGLDKYIKLEHQVVSASWDEDRGNWTIQVQDLATKTTISDQCDILINGGGILNNWRWPDIPGLESFVGPRLHSARWDHTIELRDKVVGLIGNGFVCASNDPRHRTDAS